MRGMSDPTLPLLLAGAAGGGLSAAALWAYSVFVPRCQFWAPVIRSLPQREAVALTFDDGPHPLFTPQILDHLAARNLHATFFVIGRLARRHPALLRRIHDEGHTLGNHSFDHHHFGVNRNRAYWDAQLRDTQNAIADATGHPPLLFRPPMGFKTRVIAAAARNLRLPIIGWSVRGLDTRPYSPDHLARRILRRTAGHDIIMLHDGIEPHRPRESSQQATVDALPAILDGTAEKHLRIVPLLDALMASARSIGVPADESRDARIPTDEPPHHS
jgi:peptidoglycan-N-acetylglucosamine deacetylase